MTAAQWREARWGTTGLGAGLAALLAAAALLSTSPAAHASTGRAPWPSCVPAPDSHGLVHFADGYTAAANTIATGPAACDDGDYVGGLN